MSLRIATDRTCDLPKEVVERLGIEVIPLNIHIGERAILDEVDLSRDEFYEQLPHYQPHPTTAAQEYTRLPVTALDSGQLSLGLGFLVEKAAEMAKAEKKMEEVIAGLQEWMSRRMCSLHLKHLNICAAADG